MDFLKEETTAGQTRRFLEASDRKDEQKAKERAELLPPEEQRILKRKKYMEKKKEKRRQEAIAKSEISEISPAPSELTNKCSILASTNTEQQKTASTPQDSEDIVGKEPSELPAEYTNDDTVKPTAMSATGKHERNKDPEYVRMQKLSGAVAAPESSDDVVLNQTEAVKTILKRDDYDEKQDCETSKSENPDDVTTPEGPTLMEAPVLKSSEPEILTTKNAPQFLNAPTLDDVTPEAKKRQTMEMERNMISDGDGSEARNPKSTSDSESNLSQDEAMAILKKFGIVENETSSSRPRCQQEMPRGTPRKSQMVKSPETTKRRRIEFAVTPSEAQDYSPEGTPQLKAISAIPQAPSTPSPSKTASSADASFRFDFNLSGPLFHQLPECDADEFQLDMGIVDLTRNAQEHFLCPTCYEDVGFFSNYGDHLCGIANLESDADIQKTPENVKHDPEETAKIQEDPEDVRLRNHLNPRNSEDMDAHGDDSIIVACGGLPTKVRHPDGRRSDAFNDGLFMPLANSTIAIKETGNLNIQNMVRAEDFGEHGCDGEGFAAMKNSEDTRKAEEISNVFESRSPEHSSPAFNYTI